MTRAQLHNLPEFAPAISAPGVQWAIEHLRKEIPFKSVQVQGAENIILRAGKIEGWLLALDALDELKTPPAPPSEAKAGPLYSSRP